MSPSNLDTPTSDPGWENQRPKQIPIPLSDNFEESFSIRMRSSTTHFIAAIGHLVVAYSLPDFTLLYSSRHEQEVATLAIHNETIVFATRDCIIHTRNLVTSECIQISGINPREFLVDPLGWFYVYALKPEWADVGNDETLSTKNMVWPEEPLILVWTQFGSGFELWRLPVPGEGTPKTVNISQNHNPFLLRHIRCEKHSITCLAARGQTALTGSTDHTVRIWDLTSGHCKLVLIGHWGRVSFVSFDRWRVFSGSWDGTIRIWDLHTGECLHILPSNVIFKSVSPSFLVYFPIYGKLHVWNSVVGQDVFQMDEVPPNLFYHDERKLLTVSTSGVTEVRDISTGRLFKRLGCASGAMDLLCEGSLCIVLVRRDKRLFFEVWNLGVEDGLDETRYHAPSKAELDTLVNEVEERHVGHPVMKTASFDRP